MAGGASAWQNFYVMVGGVAAALTGLIFLALSLHAKTIMVHPFYRDRAFASILSLMSQVFLSGAVLVPSQPPLALGIEVELVALYFLIRSLRAVRLPRSVGSQVQPRPRWLWGVEWTAWLLWLIALLASGGAWMIGMPAGFYLLAISMAYMFASNVWTAWVLIAEVSG